MIPASIPGPVWLSATGHRACPRVRRRAHPAHPSTPQGGRSHTQIPVMCTIPPFKTLFAHPWGLGSLRGRTAHRQRGVGCSRVTELPRSCKRVRSLQYMPCRTAALASTKRVDVQRRASRCASLPGGVCLTEITREPHASVGMAVWGGSPCTAVTPTCMCIPRKTRE